MKLNIYDLSEKAFNSYFRKMKAAGIQCEQPGEASTTIETLDGVTRVTLNNVNGHLATFKVGESGKMIFVR